MTTRIKYICQPDMKDSSSYFLNRIRLFSSILQFFRKIPIPMCKKIYETLIEKIKIVKTYIDHIGDAWTTSEL